MFQRPFYLALAILALTAAPALAGTATYTDGSGTWRPTNCKPPVPPAAYSYDPEVAADNLNNTNKMKGQYISAVHDYMTCVSQEAQKDAQAAAQMIVDDAETEIQAIQKQADAVSVRLPSGPQKQQPTVQHDEPNVKSKAPQKSAGRS